MKIIYWDEVPCHDTDCMHTCSGEVNSVFDMSIDSNGSPPARHPFWLTQHAQYAVHVNGRFKEQLKPLHKVLPMIRSTCFVWLVFAHTCQHISAWCCIVHFTVDDM